MGYKASRHHLLSTPLVKSLLVLPPPWPLTASCLTQHLYDPVHRPTPFKGGREREPECRDTYVLLGN
jgi:hypothetical protein